VARAYPDQQLHVVMDNYAAHKRPEVKAWLKANPRIQVHFTPTSASWLNLVEVWFGIIERQAIRRGVFPSVRDLMIKIGDFVLLPIKLMPLVFHEKATYRHERVRVPTGIARLSRR
jgi:DDE superfamily endonuclease